ncbi:MAG TPA: hypothetical protein VFG08_03890 [Candidatus Polarisedimenticolia bacterium]|nr:hypothetical protein [Candidatus Polarisedimenticolia bacterium]
MGNLLNNNCLWILKGIPTKLPVALGLVIAIGFGAGPAAAAGERDEQGEQEAATADGKKDRPGGQEESGQKPQPKLSFTDEDLKKYHQPQGDDAEDAAVLEGIDDDEKPQAPPAAQGAPLVRTPIDIAAPPAADPLKEYKDREEREKFRAQQLETLRARIDGLEKRLAYLNEKRLAIIDPLRIMPQPQSADDTAKEAGLGANELLTAVEAEIATTEASLQGARDSLVTIETRFSAESR